jgi:hypothetical protein
MERGGDRHTSPSIDRLDNSRGYEPDNCWVICFDCNTLKRDAESPGALLQAAQQLRSIVEAWERKVA